MVDVELRPGEWRDRARTMRGEGWQLTDICGLDRIGLGFDDRFGIVAQLLHPRNKERVTIHVAAEGEPPTVPSVVELWAGASFYEREAYDMFGIHFEGHPDLTRILMPDEWEGHPLRKDYAVGKVPVDFVRQPFLQIQGPGQGPNFLEAQQDVDDLGQTKREPQSSETRTETGESR